MLKDTDNEFAMFVKTLAYVHDILVMKIYLVGHP